MVWFQLPVLLEKILHHEPGCKKKTIKEYDTQIHDLSSSNRKSVVFSNLGAEPQINVIPSTGSHQMASLIVGLTCSIPSLAASVIFSAACRSTAWSERNPSVGFVLNQRDWLKGDGKIELIYIHINTHIILINDVSSGTTQIHTPSGNTRKGLVFHTTFGAEFFGPPT